MQLPKTSFTEWILYGLLTAQSLPYIAENNPPGWLLFMWVIALAPKAYLMGVEWYQGHTINYKDTSAQKNSTKNSVKDAEVN